MKNITIEVYRKPSPGLGDGDNTGHLRAMSDGLSVTIPCSLSLIDDKKMMDDYIIKRVPLFLQAQADKQGREWIRGRRFKFDPTTGFTYEIVSGWGVGE